VQLEQNARATRRALCSAGCRRPCGMRCRQRAASSPSPASLHLSTADVWWVMAQNVQALVLLLSRCPLQSHTISSRGLSPACLRTDSTLTALSLLSYPPSRISSGGV
jgi:hypothetical protein